jgi:S1-C subfamily serine protease
MIAKLVCIFGLAALLVAAVVFKTDQPAVPVFNSTNRVLQASVAVNNGGTGVLLQRAGRSWVLTAQHCVGNPWTGELMSTQKVSRFGTDYTATVVAHSREEDLALLLLDEVIPGDLTFADPDVVPALGTPLIHVGNLLAKYERSFVAGILSGYGREFDDKDFWQTTVAAFPGSSGGGVYTVDGKYVGMLTRGDAPTLNFIIPVRRIHDWAVAEGLEWLFDKTKPVIVIVR